jgi:membrane protease YdiL (CAAX protease family)
MKPVYLRVCVFFGVSYLLTWFGNLGNWLWPSEAWPAPMFSLGPIIAAPLVIGMMEGRGAVVEWLRRILNFHARPVLYAIAVFVPLGIAAISAILAISFGAEAKPMPYYSPLELLMYMPIVLIVGPLPEEVSFRGFGQYELQSTLSPLVASLWIGLGVVIWHVPLFVSGEGSWIVALAIMAVSVVYAWLFRTGGSVWPLVLLHFAVNYFSAGVFGRIFGEGSQAVYLGFFTAFFVGWAVLLAWRLGPHLVGDRVPHPARI